MRLMTADEVANALCVSRARVYELARTSILPCVRLGERQVRFDEDALREFIAQGGCAQADNGSDRNTKSE